MQSCAKDVRSYHDERVRLPQDTVNKLKQHRDANRDRMRSGLEKSGDPPPSKHVRQGSDAMRTTVQHPDNDYDIDDGVVFSREDLKGRNGGEKTPLDARKMVCSALQDTAFSKQPDVHTNCVRVYYNEGYHVDIPVYRQEEEDGSTVYELASAEWRKSDPEGVTEWFDAQLGAKHPSGTTDYQMRRMVRYLKVFGASRPSWNMPSGFIWTVLVSKAFAWPDDEHDDAALRELMNRIRDRLRANKRVHHPVLDEYITKSDEDACMTECEAHLVEALAWLDVLDGAACKRSDALKAWRKVFNTDYFNSEIKKAEDDEQEAERRKLKAERLAVSVGTSRPPSPWGIPWK